MVAEAAIAALAEGLHERLQAHRIYGFRVPCGGELLIFNSANRKDEIIKRLRQALNG
jgi:hypothetical protein